MNVTSIVDVCVAFLNVIKVLLVYNPNYSSFFPPDLYYKNLLFDLMLK